MQKRRNNKNTLAAEFMPREKSAQDSGIKIQLPCVNGMKIWKALFPLLFIHPTEKQLGVVRIFPVKVV